MSLSKEEKLSHYLIGEPLFNQLEDSSKQTMLKGASTILDELESLERISSKKEDIFV